MMKTHIKLFIAPVVLLLALSGCASHYVGSHAYGTVEAPEGMPLPTVTLDVNPDAVAGWNLRIITENIEFAPELASTEHYPGQGHAHLYINNKMIARLYGKWYHIPSLRPGRNKIVVTLNSNDHNAYAVNGELISDSTVIEIEEPKSSSSSSSGGSSSSSY